MARLKEKETTINLELMLEIKNKFPKLMDFYKLAGLRDMSRQDFYAVMRMDESLSEHVRAVELGFNVANKLREMAVEELLKRVQGIDSTMIGDEEMVALRVLVRRTII
jgi:hypothetical protein